MHGDSHPGAPDPGLSSTRVAIICAALVALLATIYWPGLHGPFLADDMPNFVANPMVKVEAFTWDELATAASSNYSGPLRRPIAALTFGLDYWRAGGFDQFTFKSTNLLIHILNAMLALALVRRLLAAGGVDSARRRDWLAGAAVLIWAAHPLHLTNVLYVVQRMNSLATLFCLLGLLVFVIGRQRLRDGRPAGLLLMLAGVGGGTSLGMLCKENAVLLPAFTLVLELSLFRGQLAAAGKRRLLTAYYAITAVLPYIAGLVAAVLVFDLWRDAYATRDFNVVERLLTGPRVLGWYLSQTLLPDLGKLSIYHDDYLPSRGLFEPASTVVALAGWLLAIGVAWWSLRRTPWLALAIGWFLAGHSMEASVVPLELVYEHRNYLPSLGLIVGLVMLASGAIDRLSSPTFMARTASALTLLVLAGATLVRAGSWSDAETMAGVALAKKPDSARAHSVQATLLSATGASVDRIYMHHARAAELAPRSVGARLALLKFVVLLEDSDVKTHDGQYPALRSSSGEVLMRLDPATLGAARERLGAEIEHLIETDVVNIDMVASLRHLAECAERGYQQCQALVADLGRWTAMVLTRPDLPVHQRQTLLWFNARARLLAGEPEQALATMDEAVALRPDYLPFRHLKAQLLVRAGRLDEAQAQIEALARVDGDAVHRQAVESLEGRLREARRGG